jgi:DNA ligase-1
MRTILLQDGRKQWRATVNGNTVTYEWGVVGSTQQTDEKKYLLGKNIGKSNETTPAQQCMAEAMVKVRKKIEKGYKVVEGELEEPIVTTSNLTVTKPMKANDLHEHMKKIPTWDVVGYQPKLNGNRCKIDITNGKMYSSSRKEITHLSEIGIKVAEGAKHLIKEGVTYIDGELYCHDMSFNAIQTLVRRVSGETKHKKGDEIDTPEKFKAYKTRLEFHAFDVETSEPVEDRIELLETVIVNEKLKIVPTHWDKAEKYEEYCKKFEDLGYEGVIIRLMEYPYEPKKSLGIFKWKNFIDSEFKVLGFTSEKNDPSKLGAAVLRLEEGSDVTFEATPSMTDEKKAEIWENQKEYIGQWATVKYQNRDEKSNIPIIPVLTHFRDPDDMS